MIDIFTMPTRVRKCSYKSILLRGNNKNRKNPKKIAKQKRYLQRRHQQIYYHKEVIQNENFQL
jgi:hypothetical protein